jgi:hypothetical protein
MSRQSKSWF